MTRTNIDIDDELIGQVMCAFGLHSKREAVHLALERLMGGGPMDVREQLEMEGIGWEGDLDEMRSARFVGWDDDAAG